MNTVMIQPIHSAPAQRMNQVWRPQRATILYLMLGITLPESKTTKVGKAAVRTGTIFRANLSGAMKELFSQKACKIHEVSAKATLTGKVQKDKKLGCAPRDDGSEGDKSHALFKDNYMPEGMRKCGDGTLDPTKHKFKKKKSSHLQDEMKVPHGKQPSTGKKKPKGKQK
ncbi:hypothetical protein OIU84_018033 [Salix udensis]|uniref:Uncharacterized protein n=1 Tax=Salix udensis TaxID=889485 RepID=A0AAD6L3F1_9ROSI|nr:hypothetical protein OIU84_018033 [Salix udensis]